MSKENRKIVRSTGTGHYISSDEFLKSALSKGRFRELKKSKFFKDHFSGSGRKKADSHKK